MLKISTIIKNFIRNLVSLVRETDGGDAPTGTYMIQDEVLAPIPAVTSQIRVGNILIFRYSLNNITSSDWDRMVLVAGCSRGHGGGIIHARTGNTLVSCFKLEGISEQVISLIIRELYNRRKAGPKVIESLKKLIGDGSYKTYILSRMNKIYRVQIPTRVVREKRSAK